MWSAQQSPALSIRPSTVGPIIEEVINLLG
jgi:hypothetical protein